MRPPLLLALAGCTAEGPAFTPDFTVRPGVEVASVLDAAPGARLTLYDDADTELITIIADALGQAHFAYVPDEPLVVDSTHGQRFPLTDGGVVRPGTYEIRDDETGETSGPFDVRAIDDLPDVALYEEQVLGGVAFSPLTGDLGDADDGFQYVETRDGTLIGVMVRFPDPLFYGEGPYPTVIEYSGYSPSRPDRIEPGSRIANALGYATVGVNMRGTGCSGGVFDVFNRAQHADGYDVVEVIARQEWVLNHQVGMVGLSYPGISQLFVASTNPPSLAGIVPQSTIADPWEMQWPGGVYNSGFTRQWIEARDADSATNGSSWVVERIAAGDETCEANVALSAQNIEFESFLHGLEFRPRDAGDRDLNRLVTQIEAPVYLGGAWQDEQTGALFGGMLDRFDASPATRFVLANGRHPDGYAPDAVVGWFEFLELFVAERVPEIHPAIRSLGADQFGGEFGIVDYTFPPDRFAGSTHAEALAAWKAEPPVLVRFEMGAGDAPGAPVPTFDATFDRWPPPADARTWYADAGGRLSEAPSAGEGADLWRFDTDALSDTFFGPAGYQLLVPLWDIDWRRFAAGDVASYLSEPFAEAEVLAGPAIADLWVRSPADDLSVQVTLSEVREDGVEVLVQSGWLRLGHRAATEGDDLRLERTYATEDFAALPVNEWVSARVAIPSFAHPVRAGSSLRMTVSAPGRNHGTWEFEAPEYGEPPVIALGRGGARASSLTLHLLDLPVPDGLPPCPSLRGQPCRDWTPVENVPE